MGNLCGKQSPPDPFSSPGRTLSSAPPPSNTRTSSIPKNVGRKLGGSAPTSLQANSSVQGASSNEEARRKAAEAAEARLNKSQPMGKLGAQLAEQKKKTRTDTLKDASDQERLAREAQQAEETRNYN